MATQNQRGGTRPAPRGGGSTTGQQPRSPIVPTNLTKEVSNFDQFQQRIQELANHYGVTDQLCTAVGSTVIPGGGGMPTWYGRVWLFNGNQTIADVNGPVLETVVNRCIEDAAYWLAKQTGGTMQTAGPGTGAGAKQRTA